MSIEVHIEWRGSSHLAGRLDAAERGASVSFTVFPTTQLTGDVVG